MPGGIMSDNQVTMTGNITRDPEIRFTNTGKSVTSFSIAVGRRYQVNGEWQEQTSFFNVSAWGQLGENVAASASKGSRVTITGRMDQREYTDKEGNKRQAVDLIADEVAASLKWATVEITRNPKSQDSAYAGKSASSAPAVESDESPFS